MLGASGVYIVGGHDVGTGRRKPMGEIDYLSREEIERREAVVIRCKWSESCRGAFGGMATASRKSWTYKGWSALVNNRTIGRICNMLKSRS